MVWWIKWHENRFRGRKIEKKKHSKNSKSFGLFRLSYMQKKRIWNIAGKIDWLDHKGS